MQLPCNMCRKVELLACQLSRMFYHRSQSNDSTFLVSSLRSILFFNNAVFIKKKKSYSGFQTIRSWTDAFVTSQTTATCHHQKQQILTALKVLLPFNNCLCMFFFSSSNMQSISVNASKDTLS